MNDDDGEGKDVACCSQQDICELTICETFMFKIHYFMHYLVRLKIYELISNF